MFYVKGIDICNDKEMFNFLKKHFTYYTLNSWNGLKSIAHNVKVHKLNLSGDCWTALNLLNNGRYEDVGFMIRDWEQYHPGYSVCFRGRSDGYLVLTHADRNSSVIPETIDDYDSYEDYKEYCQEEFGGVKHNRDELRATVRLVQSFDKLCDEIRDFVDELSTIDFAKYEIETAVDLFNERYENDLEMLDFNYLSVDDDGSVDLSEVIRLQSLTEAFMRLANRESYGYKLKFIGDARVRLEAIY